MGKLKKDRVLYLARALRKNARNRKGSKFDITSWMTKFNPEKPLSCGTTACTLGFASLLPKFEKQGLQLINWMPWYNGHCGNNAGALFFGLSDNIAYYFFTPRYFYYKHHKGAKGELEVANRLSYLARYGEESFLKKYQPLIEKIFEANNNI